MVFFSPVGSFNLAMFWRCIRNVRALCLSTNLHFCSVQWAYNATSSLQREQKLNEHLKNFDVAYEKALARTMRKSMQLIVLHKLWSSVYIIANILHFVCVFSLLVYRSVSTPSVAVDVLVHVLFIFPSNFDRMIQENLIKNQQNTNTLAFSFSWTSAQFPFLLFSPRLASIAFRTLAYFFSVWLFFIFSTPRQIWPAYFSRAANIDSDINLALAIMKQPPIMNKFKTFPPKERNERFGFCFSS